MTLPVMLSSFVGRERELDGLRRTAAATRLLTITGLGGSGKTRVAIELANSLADSGVVFVDLTTIARGGPVLGAVMRAAGQPAIDDVTVAARILGARPLLVLDNAEHVLDELAPLVERLLASAPTLQVIATSREPLGCAGETIVPLPPLNAEDAAELFLNRSLSAGALFDPAREAHAIAELCERLEGLPLALELAAARTRALSPAELLALVSSSDATLQSTRRTAPERHRSLAASMAWSYELLSEPERAAFRRLSVLGGTFDLAAAVAVVTGDSVTSDAVSIVTELVQKSLLAATATSSGATRYRMLESVRAFAAEQLAAAGETDAVRSLHAEFFLELIETTAREARSATSVFPDEIEQSYTNLLAALAWFRSQDDADRTCRTAIATANVLSGWGWPAEGLRLVEPALELIDTAAPRLAVRVLALAGRANSHAGRPAVARELFDRAHAIAAEHPEAGGERALQAGEVEVAIFGSNDIPTMREALTVEAIDELEHLPTANLLTLNLLAAVLAFDGETRRAEALARKLHAVALARGLRSAASQAAAFVCAIAWMRGDMATAREIEVELAAAGADGRDAWAIGLGESMAAFNAANDNDAAAARRHIERVRESFAAANNVANLYFADFVTAMSLGPLGDPEARVAAKRAFEGLQEPGQNGALIAWATQVYAHLLELDGDLIEARAVASGERTRTQGFDDAVHAAMTKRVLAGVARVEGRLAEAEDELAPALSFLARSDVRPDAIEALSLFAGIQFDAGNVEVAARLMGAVDTLTASMSRRLWNGDLDRIERDRSAITEALGQQAASDLMRKGAQLSLEDAVEYALRGRGVRRRPTAGWESLTPVEANVVELVVQGLTNDEVASRLFVSRNTVKTHLQHIFGKLGVSRRAELSALVVEQKASGVTGALG